jgi:superfamily II DNA or RNA helicase
VTEAVITAAAACEGWEGTDSPVCREVEQQARANLESYRVNAPLLKEQANNERAAFQGGYAQRQLYELIQNGADALIRSGGGRVEVILTDDAFYCANEGEPIDVPGAQAILLAHVSQKRGDEIGRFGLGFKSVLEVTDSPEFYSRSGSFVWDYDRGLADIAEVVPDFVPGESPAPRLRLAYPVDPAAAFAGDPILADLCPWATTIVKLPLNGRYDWLNHDLATFPREFLLFSRHVGRLILDDRSSAAASVQETLTLPIRREIEILRQEDQYRLREAGDESTWMLFSTVYAPSREAQHDAGEMTHREHVPIHWALPLEGRTGPGVLWAFFPTEYETTLSGIVNAPWKTTSERRNLLDGVFNQELLGVVAQLVVNNLDALPLADDPGRVLDIIPARGREARNWADRVLTDGVYELAALADSLPDVDGRLRRPGDLSLHPALRSIDEDIDADAAQELLNRWAAASPDRNWCHPTVEQRDRRPRVERLIREGDGVLAGWRAWLEALVEEPTVEASKAAILIAADAVDQGFVAASQISTAQVVLTRDGALAAADPDDLFLPSEYEGVDDVEFVHPDLAADPEARGALERLDIKPVDAAADLESVLRGGFRGWLDHEWEQLWTLIRRIDADRAAAILKARRRVPAVKVRSGKFRPLAWTLLPGAIIPEGADRDRDSVVDTDYHRDDLELLHLLGAVAAPQAGLGSSNEPWFFGYEQEALVGYRQELTGTRRPRENLLQFNRSEFAGPLTALEGLSDEGRMLFTEAALAAQPELEPWQFFHGTQRDVYPVLDVEHPVTWRIRSEGRLRTSLGPRPPAGAVGPRLAEWAAVFPVAEVPEEIADRLGLAAHLDEIPEAAWAEGAEAAMRLTDDTLLGRFYVEASRRVEEPPEHLRCRIGHNFGPASPSLVTVLHDPREMRALIPQKVPTLLVASPEEADELRARWGLNMEQKVETSFDYAPAGEAVPIIDQFPALQWEVDTDIADLILVPCGQIRLETSTQGGQETEVVNFYADDGRVYYNDTLEPAELLKLLAPIVGLNVREGLIEDIVTRSAEAERRQRTVSIRRLESDQARLLAAVGAPALRSRLPKGLLRILEEHGEPLEGEAIADLALAVYGIDVLRTYRRELQEQGLEPPTQWGGSSRALAFVRKLGFSRDYAGFEQPKRAPLLEVEGPPNVPEPHPYQRQIIDEFKRLVRGELDGKRALLSLPTGAGKTRVAVDALIEAVRHDGLRGPILWVAQSDELCEQAVQTWSFVWRGLGPERELLAVSRLWGGNEATPDEEAAAHVVVATIQKLQPGCINDPDYAWLADAGCVVIDEAHHSTTPSYSELLRWLQLDQSKQTRPLVGLTATPYRGISKDETERLVSRYGKRRLDQVAFGDENPYPILQREGILASVEHKLLQGADVELSADELAHVERMRVLPPRAEGELGRSVERNRRILEEVMSLPEDWTVLLFATSVDHAQTMAALLSLEGIPAKPITGLTDDGPRRHYIEEFRQKRIRVLTNYNVLTQGFDAPAVRAVIVARPTFSPNLYQQMIGRGLRGERNGGKDSCLIVNVEDNVVSFGEELAFRDFEYLWNAEHQDGR